MVALLDFLLFMINGTPNHSALFSSIYRYYRTEKAYSGVIPHAASICEHCSVIAQRKTHYNRKAG
jgi:hypothetical protein